jgi:DNA-binding NtrC family response regulator
VPAPETDGGGALELDAAELPTLADTERRLVAAALRRSGGNKNEAARILGIDRQRLYRKIEKYNLRD